MRKAIVLASAAVLLAPVASQAKTLEELLVEKGVITKAEASGATSGAGTKVYWNKGTRVEFPDNGFTFGIATFLQERYTFTDQDEDSGGSNSSSFEVQKARFVISGTALHNEFSYYFQPDFVGDSSDGENTPHLRDAYVTWHACDWADLRIGQFKTMINRGFNTSDWKGMFPERLITVDSFALGRQQGASGSLSYMDGDLVLTAGLFNGDSEGEGMNRPGLDTRHTGVVGVRWKALGKIDDYEESDVDDTQDLALSFGAAYAFSDIEIEGATLDVNDISVDANMKYQGLAINAEFFTKDISLDDSDADRTPVGGYIQAGYFLMPKKFELAARYAITDCDASVEEGAVLGGACSGDVDKFNEVGVTANYYWWKHHLKASIAYLLLNQDGLSDDDEDVNTNQWMFQLSSYF